LVERVEDATRARLFPTLALAKSWAEENAARDEYGMPRVETHTYLDRDGAWLRIAVEELVDGAWGKVEL